MDNLGVHMGTPMTLETSKCSANFGTQPSTFPADTEIWATPADQGP